MAKTAKIIAHSEYRYRATASQKRAFGGSTVTQFIVYRSEDAKDPSKWLRVVGFGKTPGDRKTDAIRRSGLLVGPLQE